MLMCYCKIFVLINLASTLFAQNDYCQEGSYGNNCELECSKQCRPLQTIYCNKKTGKCAEGCTNGYFGDQCDKLCSCPSGICFQESGECIGTGKTTVSTTKNTTQNIISTTAAPVFDGVAAGWRITAIILLIIIFFMLCGGVVMFLCVRFKKKEIALTGCSGTWKITFSKAPDAEVSGDEEKGADQVLTATTPLMQENAKAQATGGDNETTKQHGDQSEETIHKETTQVEELKQKIKHLQEEKRRSGAEIERYQYRKRRSEAVIERYQYRENVIQGILVPNSKSTKSSMSTNLLMSNKGVNKDNWLHCPHLMFDKETVNVKVAQIDDNMVLWNIPDTRNPENNSRRFQNFQGAISTEPLVNTGLYQYFEAVFDIALPQPVGEGIIAQVGLVGDKDKEPITPFIDTRKHCFVVQVASSKKQDKICLLLINNGKTEHMLELMNNISGSKHKVHIGIRLRKDRKRIQIFDCGAMKSVQKIDIHLGEKIWPVFGVCAQNEASVNVQLIAGRDIEMGKEKKKMVESKYMLQ